MPDWTHESGRRACRRPRTDSVIRGEAGIGKTALLRYLAEDAAEFRTAEMSGVEAEIELAYAEEAL